MKRAKRPRVWRISYEGYVYMPQWARAWAVSKPWIQSRRLVDSRMIAIRLGR